MSFWLEPVAFSPEQRAILDKYLTHEAIERLECACTKARSYSGMATHTEIRRDLAAVVKAAETITKFIEGSVEARALVVFELLNDGAGLDLWTMRSGLEALAEAAAIAEGCLRDKGQGRAPNYIFIVSLFVQVLTEEGICISKSGRSKCRAIMDACFEVIGIPKSSEAAIRAYLARL